MRKLFFIAFLAISNTVFSQGWIELKVEGDDWSKTLTKSDIDGAGNDYKNSFESGDRQTFLTITPNNKNKSVKVSVQRSNNNWHGNLKLKVKRTTNGTNSSESTISINTGYHYITDHNTVFFTCEGYPTRVPLQYEITGISVLLPVKTYSTTITYTVMYEN